MTSPVVYLVDDEPICLEPMQALITAFGYECRGFPTGEALLENITPVVHGMILADYRLPGINGLQLFEQVRSMGYELPFVLVSGHVDESDVSRAIQAGVNSVLHKPVRFDELKETIDHVLISTRPS